MFDLLESVFYEILSYFVPEKLTYEVTGECKKCGKCCNYMYSVDTYTEKEFKIMQMIFPKYKRFYIKGKDEYGNLVFACKLVTKMQLVASEATSDIYIKFIITKKNLTLPIGAVATVEGSGLAGSKSLEIYPPKPDSVTDKIIESKDSTRLNKVMGLFNQIFKDIEQIFTSIGHAATELSKDKKNKNKFRKMNVVTPVDVDEGLTKLDKNLDKLIEADKGFKKNLHKFVK